MTKVFIQDEKEAIEKAKTIAAETEAVLVINTHGFGYEIVSKDFHIDRMYYHNSEGRKTFFTPIVYVHPAGVLRYLHR